MKDDSILQLVTFKLENDEFGVDILRVQEINRMMNITKIPNAPTFTEGVINLRGKIIPIIDLRKKLGFVSRVYDKSTRIIVVELDGIVLGFVVDSVSEVLRIPRDIIEPPPSIIGNVESDFIEGVGKLQDRLLILLELKKIFTNTERKGIEKINLN
ncbi:MAG TPA: chemotaxis protein CheW [Syntrophorhabdaceae bacterium]|jgi:purine-binding chemotaxis protein CheW|nr:chemotaxis protein CheW [Syntrophorhabdaceae bacterium]MDI9560347.1 chemotaxis protein CheW [Pseudomonadota bacterium]OQC48981.1 MAG: Chemotaxis protein CheW [Deltaproteobacteria bacterium ADurb.Bin026]HOF58216.1 chemotaxis protein CheW [Syntrophorhabdaceae bacterium]HOG39603.1 chemotaxis protein CheW [Syntrophorhabdaceae bacterium]